MRFSLAIVVAAAAGAFLGSYAGEERSLVTRTTGHRTATVTKTVTKTVTRTVVRPIVRPDRRAGNRVFLAACSRCHTLDPRDWTGDRINLARLQPSYRWTVEKVTRGGIAMPSFEGKLSERQIRDVAAFVTAKAPSRTGKSP
jgi:mono/diheme cytochrome c family protein